jgi:hypothetical protein
MNLNTILGILSAIGFALPVLIIIIARLYMNISLLALVAYFLFGFSYNLMVENVLVVSPDTRRVVGVLINYLDVPFILTAMLMFCTGKWTEKAIKISMGIFGLFELVIFSKYQFSFLSSKYIMGPGILLIMGFSLYFFINNIKLTIMQGKGVGKTLMVTSILFAYGSYLIVYFFAFIQKAANQADVFIIYYLTSIIFSGLMSAGLFYVQRRVREIKEVQNTRKELSVFFDHQPKRHKRYLQ